MTVCARARAHSPPPQLRLFFLKLVKFFTFSLSYRGYAAGTCVHVFGSCFSLWEESCFSLREEYFPGGSDGKASASNARDRVQSLGWEDLLEKEMATHSSILAWKILWTEEPGRQQSMGSQRVGHN